MSDDAEEQAAVAVNHHRPNRWWLDIRWITAGVVAATFAFLLWGLFGPEPAIRVLRETTFLTEPLAADGLPDYCEALLAMAGPAPPPEENAAAGLFQILWPFGIDDADLPAACRALGIPDKPPISRLRPPYEEAASKITHDAWNAGLERPWSSADLPELAAWLVANEDSLDRLRAAADRPRYWFPSPLLLTKREGLLMVLPLPDVAELRMACRHLSCRAMWHLGEGRHAEAWHDIRAIYRLSRLLVADDQRPQCFVTTFGALACEAMADEAVVRALLGSDGFPPALLAEIRRELESLRRSGSFAEFILMERIGFIDLLIGIVCREPLSRAARARALGSVADATTLDRMLLRTSIDWNVVLRRANEAYDRFESAWRRTTFEERRALLEQEESDLVARLKSPLDVGRIPLLLLSRGARSDYLGSRLSDRFMPAFSGGLNVITRGQTRSKLTHTAVALAAWRLDQEGGGSSYPERLDALVPQYFSDVPIDPYSGQPLIYERRNGGYLLASVGQNGTYDGGSDADGWIVNGEWQDDERDVPWNRSDLVVRMPVPGRPFVRPSAP